jgi:serine/threonine-protein kinase
MHSHILHSADLRGRFEREAKVAAQVESEFIVDVFDAGVDDATQMPYLVMELLRGEELGKRLRRLGRLPAAEVAHFVHQTALALDKTHQANIVHRDLKPENLFLTEREDGMPRIKVLDFGIAKVVTEGVTSGSSTMSIGTPLYMSPEQFQPRAWVTGASDVYSLGMIAYTLLVGGAYWEEEAREGSIFQFGAIAIHGPQEPASVRAYKRGVRLPGGFDAWFAKVTAKDPEQRFPTATAAARELSAVLGVPVGAPAIARIEPVAPSAPAPLPPPIPPPLHATDGERPEEKTLVMAPLSERVDPRATPHTGPAPAFAPVPQAAPYPGAFFPPQGPVLTPTGSALTPAGAALSAAPPPGAPHAWPGGSDTDAAALQRARQRGRSIVVAGLSAVAALTIGAVAIFARSAGSGAGTSTAASATGTATAPTATATAAIETATAATAEPTPEPTASATATATATAAVAAATGEPPRPPRPPAVPTSSGQGDKPRKTGKKHYTQE